ncbi:diacylglycerol acyltransferase-domain-containing protein [Catenaria anguillulae PL171]|uniref:diacylglycerol O-acyltransferase n=1 Tax=Catenaria anguillulae PL171 TaxID=765915 RepID=A0A1Y2HZK0_9FUNG|nr:diacylglycerol acyltransferase-domain-containing protein [Catenaria anguillulae PL171]
MTDSHPSARAPRSEPTAIPPQSTTDPTLAPAPASIQSPARSYFQLSASRTHVLLLTWAAQLTYRLLSATHKLNSYYASSSTSHSPFRDSIQSLAYPAAQNIVVFAHLFSPFACFFTVTSLLALLANALVHVVPHLSVLSLKLVARWPFPGLVTAQSWPSDDTIEASSLASTHQDAVSNHGAYLWLHWAIVISWTVYLAWVAVDFNTPFTGGTERMRWFRSWSGWAKFWRTYFPVTLVRTSPLPTNRNYIFGLHPHGLYCLGAYANFVVEHDQAPNPQPAHAHSGPATSTNGWRALFPGIETRTGTLKINFLLPVWRELNLVWKMISVDYESCKTWLVHGMGKRMMMPAGADTGSAQREHAGQADGGKTKVATCTGLRPRHDSGVVHEDAQAASSSVAANSDVHHRRVTYVDEEVAITDSDPFACPTTASSFAPNGKIFKDEAIVGDPASTTDSSPCPHVLPEPSPNGAGRALLICIGGAQESLLSRPNHIDLVLLKRKGFIRLALDTGASVVPVLSFGETDIYKQYQPVPGSPLYHFQRALKWSMGWTLPMMYGRVGMWLPFRRPITTVVGEPVHCPHVPNPSREVVDEWHARYVERLREVWEANRGLYAGEETKMQLVA